jgi:hypothetical protein
MSYQYGELDIASKRKHMDILEQLQIQKYHHERRLMPEQNPHEYNPLSQLLSLPNNFACPVHKPRIPHKFTVDTQTPQVHAPSQQSMKSVAHAHSKI